MCLKEHRQTSALECFERTWKMGVCRPWLTVGLIISMSLALYDLATDWAVAISIYEDRAVYDNNLSDMRDKYVAGEFSLGNSFEVNITAPYKRMSEDAQNDYCDVIALEKIVDNEMKDDSQFFLILMISTTTSLILSMMLMVYMVMGIKQLYLASKESKKYTLRKKEKAIEVLGGEINYVIEKSAKEAITDSKKKKKKNVGTADGGFANYDMPVLTKEMAEANAKEREAVYEEERTLDNFEISETYYKFYIQFMEDGPQLAILMLLINIMFKPSGISCINRLSDKLDDNNGVWLSSHLEDLTSEVSVSDSTWNAMMSQPVYAQSMAVSILVVAYTLLMNIWGSLYLRLPKQKTLYVAYSITTAALVVCPFLTVVTFILSPTFRRGSFFFLIAFICWATDIGMIFLPLILRRVKYCHHPLEWCTDYGPWEVCGCCERCYEGVKPPEPYPMRYCAACGCPKPRQNKDSVIELGALRIRNDNERLSWFSRYRGEFME